MLLVIIFLAFKLFIDDNIITSLVLQKKSSKYPILTKSKSRGSSSSLSDSSTVIQPKAEVRTQKYNEELANLATLLIELFLTFFKNPQDYKKDKRAYIEKHPPDCQPVCFSFQ